MARHGEFRLLRTSAGVTAFARVGVSIGDGPAKSTSVVAAASIDAPSDWLASALDGCARCLQSLRAAGRADATTRVVVESVVGTHVDTTTDAVAAAAVLAVAAAFDLVGDFDLIHADRWHVEWRSNGERLI